MSLSVGTENEVQQTDFSNPKKINWILIILSVVAVLALIAVALYFVFNSSQEKSSEPLYFQVMIHMEGDYKYPDQQSYDRDNEKLKEIIDLFDKYDAKITLESALPYAEASVKYGNSMLNYALEKGMGVGTHCDMDSLDFAFLKQKIDLIVGAENNLGCSGGTSKANWVQEAYDGGFSYMDGLVMYAYLAVPLKNRPINSETGKSFTDDEIRNIYYHDPAPPELKDRIYPKLLKDTQDFEEDKDGILLVMLGELGVITSLSEDRKNCFPKCDLTQEDTDYILEQIDSTLQIRDNSKFASLNIHFPLNTIALPAKNEAENKIIVENWLKQMQNYQNQGKIKWATMKEAYEKYLEVNNIVTTGTINNSQTSENKKSVIYATVFSHNEDDSPRYDVLKSTNGKSLEQQYTDYVNYRNSIIALAKVALQEKAAYDFQPDWVFLETAKRFELDSVDTQELFKNSNGKNILRYLSEDLSVVIDPHSHENLSRNYADVAYLISLFEVEPTNIVGGFIMFSDDNSDLDWEKFRNPLKANYYNKDYIWNAGVIWGGAKNHKVRDPNIKEITFSGVFRPKSFAEPMVHDSKSNLIYLGNSGWGFDWFSILLEKVKEENNPEKIYTYSLPCFELDIYNEVYVNKKVSSLENSELLNRCRTQIKNISNSKTADISIEWKHYPEIAEIWKTDYNEQENILIMSLISEEKDSLPTQVPKGSCGDGICQAPERQNNVCPEDCE